MKTVNKAKLYVSDCTNLKEFKAGGIRNAELNEAKEPILIGIVRQIVESVKSAVDNNDSNVNTIKGAVQMHCEDQSFITSNQFAGNDNAVGLISDLFIDILEKKLPDKLRYELQIFIKPSKQSPTGYSFDYRTITSAEPINLFNSDDFVNELPHNEDEDRVIEDRAIEEKPKKTPKAK